MANKPSNHFFYNMANDYFSGKTVKAIAIASNGSETFSTTDYDNLADAGAAADIASYEFDGTGYTAYGPTMANVAVTEDDANDRAKIDCDDFVLTSLAAGTHPIEGWLFYVDGATDADRKIIGWFEYANPQTPNGENFTVEIPVDGFMRVRKAA